ncbi:MAG: ABC transporter permease [Flavobacteriaceae bacterium]|nr:ABC transporter permease [Flavobacteriaceae bacterium]
MNFPFYIAKRYLFSKSRNTTINIITRIALVGVIIGTMALFIVLSVFSGLKAFNINFISAADPDLSLIATQGKSFVFTDSLAIMLEDKAIAHYTKYIDERAFFSYQDKRVIANLKGVDSAFVNVIKLDTTVYAGHWLDYGELDETIVGNQISRQLGMPIDDFINPLKVYVPKPGKGYISNPNKAFKMLASRVVGAFSVTENLDKKYVFSSLEFAQELLNYKPNQISGIALKLQTDVDPDTYVSILQKRLGNTYKVKTRTQLNAVFYKMLNTENLVSYLIFTLIVIIAIFNVIGAIVMMILDKKEHLKTLYNLGTTLPQIKKIFVLHGLLLQGIGMLIGLLLGIILVVLQIHFGFLMITTNLAYPVVFNMANLLVVVLTITSLGYLAAKLASNRIDEKVLGN